MVRRGTVPSDPRSWQVGFCQEGSPVIVQFLKLAGLYRQADVRPMHNIIDQEVFMTQPMTLITIRDVASLLHYSTKTVYKKAARGEIPSIPISRRKRLFNRDAILYWLANKQMGNL